MSEQPTPTPPGEAYDADKPHPVNGGAGEVGGVPAVRTHENAATDLGRLIEQKVRAGYDYRWWIDLQHHADEIIRTVFDEH